MIQTPNRGEVWVADLNPRQGTEPGKTRPVLIVQSQTLLNVEHPSTLIVPLTTKLTDNAEPLRVRVAPSGRLRQKSDLLIDQVRAIDNRRFVGRPLTKFGETFMARVGRALEEVLGLAI
jgi:mRNA interferase MazF